MTTTPASACQVVDGADTGLDVVTGAFSYSGAAIARALHASGRQVRTVTGHPNRAPDHSSIEARPLDFDDQLGLVESLRGATTLYNTYWVRFARSQVDHDLAVANSRTLFQAARRAGVQRIVHVSITNPSIESPLPYFRGKALVERALAESDVSYAILRPAILFGGDGVLLNNIAWLLRHVPVFAVGGRGTIGSAVSTCTTSPACAWPREPDDWTASPMLSDRSSRRSSSWSARSGTPSAATPESSGCRAASCVGSRGSWGWPSTMSCSPGTSTEPCRTAWPIRRARPPAPHCCPSGWRNTETRWARRMPTSW
jgi:uncharacterized protein YbjT (DUF2867 family)